MVLSPHERAGGGMAKILIVDDEEDIRALISAILQKSGHATIEMEDGYRGLKALEAETPDLVISDIMMPGLTGFDFVGEMRKRPETAATPLIFITGVQDEYLMRRGMELGADDFLQKPFSAETLTTAVETRLKMRDALRRQSEERLEHLRENITLSLPHEMRTPLNAILAFSQIMSKDPESLAPQDVKKLSTSINNAGKRLHSLIENYLLYAQVEIASFDPKAREALAGESSDHFEKLVKTYAREKAREYEREKDLVFDLHDATVVGSHDHLARMVTEVTDNALKFSQPGSPVRIASSVAGPKVVLSITDRGSGMKSDDVESIGAFMQFDRKVREQQGTGLGLAITRRLSQLYGGDLRVTSNAGTGTTVELILVLATAG